MKPVIAVAPLFDNSKDSYWMLPGYFEVVAACGGIPIMLQMSAAGDAREILDKCSGILLTGGQDVDPTLYGEQRIPECGETCRPLDEFDKILVDYAIEEDFPLLGVCRGAQFLNVHLGGTLYQDLMTQHAEGYNHVMPKPYDAEWHTVKLSEGSDLREIFGTDEPGVNSRHHQGIKDLSPQLECEAVSDDGIVEAIRLPGKRYIRAVQWHPEHSWKKDARQKGLVQSFISACTADK